MAPDNDALDPTDVAAAEQAAVDTAIVTVDQLADGWQPVETDKAGQAAISALTAACMRLPIDVVDDPDEPTATESFVGPDGAEIDTTIRIARSLEAADERTALHGSAEHLDCLYQQITDALTVSDEMTVRDVTVARIDPNPDSNHDYVTVRVSATVTTRNMDVVTYIDLVVFQVGRAVGTINYMTVLHPPPAGDLDALVNLMIERIDPTHVT